MLLPLFLLCLSVAAAAPVPIPPDREFALAIFLLDTYPLHEGQGNFSEVVLAVEKHIAPWTPCVFYITVMRFEHAFAHSMVGSLGLQRTPVVLVSPEQTGWGSEPEGMNATLWKTGFPLFYRLMGDWRLWHMQRFAHKLGHRYLLQLDVDSLIRGDITYNIVDTFRTGSIKLGARIYQTDFPGVVWGLPELIRYYMMVEGIEPQQKLWGFCTPANAAGLFTQPTGGMVDEQQSSSALAMGVKKEGGWRPVYPYGNFLVLDLNFWLSPPIKRFTQLARESGASMRFRWNEQGVYAAVWQAFIPDSEVHTFSFEYAHGGRR